ncbi:hypothetical protein FIBSPDRAFT_889785 [Athelia psychrophila]|uniref:Uncharacterized protein n=1 Tax=Athelia psychrophila TaxID=1759441 RepID=A0A166LN11_9AGAM|nr:hypothetical protein FIBSPDRAFT_889785 [Fibularhizoctonia sp. CBS 109695]
MNTCTRKTKSPVKTTQMQTTVTYTNGPLQITLTFPDDTQATQGLGDALGGSSDVHGTQDNPFLASTTTLLPSSENPLPPTTSAISGVLRVVLASRTEILLSSTGQPELASMVQSGVGWPEGRLRDRCSVVLAGQVETGPEWYWLARK